MTQPTKTTRVTDTMRVTTTTPANRQPRGSMPTWFRQAYIEQIVKPRLQHLIRTSKAASKEALRQEFNTLHSVDVSSNLFSEWLKECGFNLVTKLVVEGPLAPATIPVAPGQDDDADLTPKEPMAGTPRGVLASPFAPSLGGIIDNGD